MNLERHITTYDIEYDVALNLVGGLRGRGLMRETCARCHVLDMAATEEIAYYKIYKNRPIYFHLYVTPFIAIYSAWLYVWFVVYGVSDHFEIGAIAGVIIFLSQVLLALFGMWSVHVRCFLTCSKVKHEILSCFPYILK